MAAITTGPDWQPAATIGAYPACDDRKTEPRTPAITTAVASAGGSVTLTNAGLVAGTEYRAVGLGPSGAVRSVVITPA
jgi:hypothetical protein